jgi:hypothetical protein
MERLLSEPGRVGRGNAGATRPGSDFLLEFIVLGSNNPNYRARMSDLQGSSKTPLL